MYKGTGHGSPGSFKVTSGDINVYRARKIADQQITYIIELAGQLDTERFKAALETLENALPILRSTLKVTGFKFTRIPGDADVTFSVVQDPENLDKSVAEFVSLPCDPEKEYPLKIRILRDKNGDTLCVKIDHVVSDAAGLKNILYFLADAYTNGKITQPMNDDRGLRQVFYKFSLFRRISVLLKPDMQKPGVCFVSGPFSAEDYFMEHTAIAHPIFERLREKAKADGSTINDIVLTSVYRAVFKNPSIAVNDAYPVMVPVDMRRYLEQNERGTVANLASALYPSICKIDDEAFQDTHARLRAKMDGLKKNTPGLGAMELMSIGTMFGGAVIKRRYEKAASYGPRFVNLTNFGVTDETRVAFNAIPVRNVYGIGPIQYAPGILIALSTFQDTLHFVIQSNDSRRFQPVVRNLLADTAAELLNYTKDEQKII